MSSELTKPLGEWVKQLFNDAFFYDNDDIAFKAMEERLSPDIKVRINGSPMDCAAYKKAVIDVRSKYKGIPEKIEELITNIDKNIGGAGSVAYKLTFVLKDLATGVEKRESTVILATVGILEGRRVLAELTEVTCVHE